MKLIKFLFLRTNFIKLSNKALTNRTNEHVKHGDRSGV